MHELEQMTVLRVSVNAEVAASDGSRFGGFGNVGQSSSSCCDFQQPAR